MEDFARYSNEALLESTAKLSVEHARTFAAYRAVRAELIAARHELRRRFGSLAVSNDGSVSVALEPAVLAGGPAEAPPRSRLRRLLGR